MKLDFVLEESWLYGITFNPDGQIDGVNGFYDKDKNWKSVWFCNNLMLKGNPISPHGYAYS